MPEAAKRQIRDTVFVDLTQRELSKIRAALQTHLRFSNKLEPWKDDVRLMGKIEHGLGQFKND